MSRAKRQVRAEWRTAVLTRDGGQCVVCSTPATDAHHLIDRGCWPDGGYVLDNGVSLCADCHQDAEAGRVTPAVLRAHAGITNVALPPSAPDQTRVTDNTVDPPRDRYFVGYRWSVPATR